MKKNHAFFLSSWQLIGYFLFYLAVSSLPQVAESYFIISIKRYKDVTFNLHAGFLPENIYTIDFVSATNEISPLDDERAFFRIKRDELFEIRYIERFINGKMVWMLEWDEKKNCRRYLEFVNGDNILIDTNNVVARELSFDQNGHLLYEKWLEASKETVYRYFYFQGKLIKTQYFLENILIREDRHLYNSKGEHYRINLFDNKGNFLGYSAWVEKTLLSLPQIGKSNGIIPLKQADDLKRPKNNIENYFISQKTIHYYNATGKSLGEKIFVYSNVFTNASVPMSSDLDPIIEEKRYLKWQLLLQEEENSLVKIYDYNNKGELINSTLTYKPNQELHNQIKYFHRQNAQRYVYDKLFKKVDPLERVFYAHYYLHGREYKNLKERIVLFDYNKKELETIDIEKQDDVLKRIVRKNQNGYKTFSHYTAHNDLYKLTEKKLQTVYNQVKLESYRYLHDENGRLTQEDFYNRQGDLLKQILYFYQEQDTSKKKSSSIINPNSNPYREVNAHLNQTANAGFYFMGRSLIEYFLYNRRKRKTQTISYYREEHAKKIARLTEKLIEQRLAKIVFLDKNKDVRSYIRIQTTGFDATASDKKKEIIFRYYSRPIQFAYKQNPDKNYYSRAPFIKINDLKSLYDERLLKSTEADIKKDSANYKRNLDVGERDFLMYAFDGVDTLQFKKVEFLEEELILAYKAKEYLPFRGSWVKYNIENGEVVEWVKLDPNDVYLMELREPTFFLAY